MGIGGGETYRTTCPHRQKEGPYHGSDRFESLAQVETGGGELTAND